MLGHISQMLPRNTQLTALRFSSLVLLVLFLFVSVDGSEKKKRFRPLDLPSGGRGSTDYFEDAYDVILFYGQDFEGSGFFWCLDRSGSMIGEQIEILRLEMNSALEQLSSESEFGIVSFAHSANEFSPNSMQATETAKNHAFDFVSHLDADMNADQAANPSGVLAGLESICKISSQCDKPGKRIILVSDGEVGPDFQQVLSQIDAYNPQRTPIDTLHVTFGIEDSTSGQQFLTSLAARYGGHFRKTEY